MNIISRLAPLAFSTGLSLTEILAVTGTFDVEQFNKGFEEDTKRLMDEQEREVAGVPPLLPPRPPL